MKNFIVSLFLLCCICAFSQTKHKDGPYKEYYKDGQLKKEGFYKNDKKIGVWKDYYENGQVEYVNNYSNAGKRLGTGESYSEKGILISETKQPQNGMLLVKKYYDSGKFLAVYNIVPQQNNERFVKSGNYKEYYEDGTLKVESIYKNNELSGVWKQFFETGEIEWEVEYVNDFKQGFYKQYYKNGKIQVEGSNNKNLKEGGENRYDSDGKLEWVGVYLNNDFNGTWEQYDAEGKPINAFKYKNGNLKGTKDNTLLQPTKIPDGYIEQVPIFPGCEKEIGNNAKKKCMADKISRFVREKFNTQLASRLGLNGRQRINVVFKIDKEGDVIDVRARASHGSLEEEAIRIISLLPKMTSGYQYGKAVTVPYSLPIVFQVASQVKKPSDAYNPYSGSNKF